jgi:hypothetical protein
MSMSKSQRRIDSKQFTIFDLVKEYSSTSSSANGQFKIIENLRDALRAAIKACPLSRHQIAGEMSHLLNETVTKEQIDSWTREDQRMDSPVKPGNDGGQEEDRWIRRHIPAEYLPAFCQVTRNTGPLKVLGGPCGIFIMPGPEALRAEIQKLDEQIREAQANKRTRMMFLKEMEKD